MNDQPDNTSDWALEQFRSHYGDPSITKWDIFHYVYAVLHHPEYRQRYAANLRRELPRIPFVSSRAGAPAPHTSNLSSRAQQNHSLTNDSAESRDPLSPDATSPPSTSKSLTQANSRSFDSAQDDRVGMMKDVAVFRAFAKAGQCLAEIHVHYEQQPEYPLTKT